MRSQCSNVRCARYVKARVTRVCVRKGACRPRCACAPVRVRRPSTIQFAVCACAQVCVVGVVVRSVKIKSLSAAVPPVSARSRRDRCVEVRRKIRGSVAESALNARNCGNNEENRQP